MKNGKSIFKYFTKVELAIWICSIAIILITSLLFGDSSFLAIIASLIGVTTLMLLAKGFPLGHLFGIIFALLYGYISYQSRYYGEMITYLGMQMPMAAISLVGWSRNTADRGEAEVKVERLTKRKALSVVVLTLAVTIFFYFVLRYFDTPNLIVSTISVTTSFAAAYLTYLRSPYYALAYASNDIILIILWGLTIPYSRNAIAMTCCFGAFLVNDIYGFINWHKLEAQQSQKG